MLARATKPTPTRKHVILSEQTSTAGRVDTASGIIRGVRIIGRTSKNGREYSDRALREACSMYEGCKVFLDHPANPGGSRSIKDRIGILENCRLDGDCVRGDLRLLKAHPMAGAILEAAETQSTRFGLSHNAEGNVVQRGGRMIVESMTSVRSVDLVDNPATNAGLFESIQTLREKLPNVASIVGDRSLTRTAQMRSLTSIMESSILEMDSPLLDMPAAKKARADSSLSQDDGTDEEASDDQAISACTDAIVAVMANADLDDMSKADRIKQILQRYDEGFYNPVDPIDVPTDASDMAECYQTGRTRRRRELIEGTQYTNDRQANIADMLRRYR